MPTQIQQPWLAKGKRSILVDVDFHVYLNTAVFGAYHFGKSKGITQFPKQFKNFSFSTQTRGEVPPLKKIVYYTKILLFDKRAH